MSTVAVMDLDAAMTTEEFIAYADDVLFGEDADYLLERVAECGPGSRLDAGTHKSLAAAILHHNQVAARYEKLTGRRVRQVSLPIN